MAAIAQDLPKPDLALVVWLAVVFGFQKLVPSYEESYRDWYPKLKKPSWTPPGWAFPTIWIPLKIMQSVAVWIAWEFGAGTYLKAALALFVLHLHLGNWWNVVFFGRHELQQSLWWMAAFWVSIAGCIGAFAPLHRVAALLMAPTLVWVSIAAKLNADIAALNQFAAKNSN